MAENNKTSTKILNFIVTNNTYFILVLLFIICSLASEHFLTLANFVNICQQYSGTVIVSIGMLFVILTGGIDLSVGSVMALGSVFTAYAMVELHLPILVSVILTLLMGIVCGLITGFLVAKAKIAAFVASLAMMTICRGIGYMISNGTPINTPANTIGVLGTARILPFLTWLTVIAIIVVAASCFVLYKTAYGRTVIMIGSNQEAVHLAGINVSPHTISVYAIAGFCSALGGIIATSRTGIGSGAVGQGLELDCIAACVIGGASLNGGSGSSLKTVVGVLVLAMIGNIMNLMSVPSYPQDVIKGIIIILAVLLQQGTSRINKN